jgi:hypothetical protein
VICFKISPKFDGFLTCVYYSKSPQSNILKSFGYRFDVCTNQHPKIQYKIYLPHPTYSVRRVRKFYFSLPKVVQITAINALITTLEWVWLGWISEYGTVKLNPLNSVWVGNGNHGCSIPLMRAPILWTVLILIGCNANRLMNDSTWFWKSFRWIGKSYPPKCC